MDGRSLIELKKRRSTTSMGLMRQPSSVNAADIWKQKMLVHMANITTGYFLRNGSATNHRKIAFKNEASSGSVGRNESLIWQQGRDI